MLTTQMALKLTQPDDDSPAPSSVPGVAEPNCLKTDDVRSLVGRIGRLASASAEGLNDVWRLTAIAPDGQDLAGFTMSQGPSASSIPTGPTSAAHVIAGFRYQLLQSIATLIALGENETLHLEVSEDFSVTAPGRATDHQVKNSQAAAGPPSYSLQSSLVRECLARFWKASSVGSTERRLVFMARGGAAVERGFTFPGGLAGLLYWQATAVDADTAPIREALSNLFAEHPLGAWLATNPSDAELRENLLRRVNWQLELVLGR